MNHRTINKILSGMLLMAPLLSNAYNYAYIHKPDEEAKVFHQMINDTDRQYVTAYIGTPAASAGTGTPTVGQLQALILNNAKDGYLAESKADKALHYYTNTPELTAVHPPAIGLKYEDFDPPIVFGTNFSEQLNTSPYALLSIDTGVNSKNPATPKEVECIHFTFYRYFSELLPDDRKLQFHRNPSGSLLLLKDHPSQVRLALNLAPAPMLTLKPGSPTNKILIDNDEVKLKVSISSCTIGANGQLVFEEIPTADDNRTCNNVCRLDSCYCRPDRFNLGDLTTTALKGDGPKAGKAYSALLSQGGDFAAITKATKQSGKDKLYGIPVIQIDSNRTILLGTKVTWKAGKNPSATWTTYHFISSEKLTKDLEEIFLGSHPEWLKGLKDAITPDALDGVNPIAVEFALTLARLKIYYFKLFNEIINLRSRPATGSGADTAARVQEFELLYGKLPISQRPQSNPTGGLFKLIQDTSLIGITPPIAAATRTAIDWVRDKQISELAPDVFQAIEQRKVDRQRAHKAAVSKQLVKSPPPKAIQAPNVTGDESDRRQKMIEDMKRRLRGTQTQTRNRPPPPAVDGDTSKTRPTQPEIIKLPGTLPPKAQAIQTRVNIMRKLH